MASFMYWMRPFPFAHTKPSGKLSSAPMSESCVIESDTWRISSTRPALVRKRKNAASRMKRYTQLSPKREIMGGVHNAIRTISNVITSLRFAIARAKPNTSYREVHPQKRVERKRIGTKLRQQNDEPSRSRIRRAAGERTRCTTISIS